MHQTVAHGFLWKSSDRVHFEYVRQVLALIVVPLSLSSRPAAQLGRRQAMASAASALLLPQLAPLAARAEEPTATLYFGAGCFWHVQHEFVMEEVATLKRSGKAITAVAGYAGGKTLGSEGRVCYHNFERLADYGQLGHAEVVEVSIPQSALPAFSKRYFDLFGTRGYRHDPQDRGGEYRSLLGLPGGMDSPLFPVIRSAAAESPMQLLAGKGDEPDTLGAKAVMVMDSNAFPFYPAEVYHQFHNDFMGPAYGEAYNKLQKTMVKEGTLKLTGCPDVSVSSFI